MKKDKESMGNIEPEQPRPLSKKELAERAYKKKWRELKIAKMRASVLRNQITEAYTILENIRFDYLGDTAFRDKIVTAKRGLEGAMSDFLLSDVYWKKRIDEHRKMTFEEYSKRSDNMCQPVEN